MPTSSLSSSLQLSAPLPCHTNNSASTTGNYILDAEYVPPNPVKSAISASSGHSTPVHHSPKVSRGHLPALPTQPPNSAELDLSKPIPKAGSKVEVGLHNPKKKGYIPMDQSPHTQGICCILFRWRKVTWLNFILSVMIFTLISTQDWQVATGLIDKIVHLQL